MTRRESEEKYNELFDTKEKKAAAFDKIAEKYYFSNFGSTSKSDLDVLLFSEYLERCLSDAKPFDDYSLSKQLGITQSRIRTLKERKELLYPHDNFDWRVPFAESIKNARFDESDHYVKIPVQDVNVLIEARHYIEEKGWYDECSLNKKLLRIPFDCFVELFDEDNELSKALSSEAKERVERISKSDNAISAFLNDFTKDGLKRFLMGASKEAILAVLGCLPFGGVAGKAFGFLGKAIERG